MNSMIWLGLFVVLLGIELMTMGLTTVWFAGGALLAFFCALANTILEVQIGVFIIGSLILLFSIRPLASKWMTTKKVATNVDSLIGQTALVTEDIKNALAQGAAEVNGQTWTARAVDAAEEIPAGTFVTIESISGVKLMVTAKK